MKKIIRLWLVYTVSAICVFSAHLASAWTFSSDVDSDSSKWSRYYNFNSDPAGADRFTNSYGNMFVRIWAEKDSWSSAGRTVSIPNLQVGYCSAQITHTGSAGSFYVRDSATYTNLSPVVSVPRSLYSVHNISSVLSKVRTNFLARNKNVFARFYMPGGVDGFYSQYGGNVYVKKTAYIDDLVLSCF